MTAFIPHFSINQMTKVKHEEVCLISLPWHQRNKPSIQISTLKAYIESKLSLKTQCIHSHLLYSKVISAGLYDLIFDLQSNILGEWSFAQLVSSPDRRQKEKALKKLLGSYDDPVLPSSAELARLLRKATDEVVSQIKPSVKVIGLSIVIWGVSAALFLAERIKKKRPDVKIVIGGPALNVPLGKALVDNFDQVDYFIFGEGELALEHLLISFRKGVHRPDDIQSLYWREKAGDLCPVQLTNFNETPPPDYDDFFGQIKLWNPAIASKVNLPIETSRGCWWRSAKKAKGGCSFCSLSHQWVGYRLKSANKIAQDILHLSKRYNALSFIFIDNIQSPSSKLIKKMCDKIKELHLDLDLYVELRANLDRSDIMELYDAGMRGAFIGIEAFDDGILQVMRKGITVYQILKTLKSLCEMNIPYYGLLMIGHPGCKASDIVRSSKLMSKIMHFAPAEAAPFYLYRDSNVFKWPANYGIDKIRPSKISHSCTGRQMMIRCANTFDFRGVDLAARQAWKMVEKKAEQWNEEYREPSFDSAPLHALVWRRGPNGIHIVEVKNGIRKMHYLDATESSVFLCFVDGSTIEDACIKLNISNDQMMKVIKCIDKFIYTDGVYALSLPFRYK